MKIDQIACQALQLEPEDRALLAETLWESLEDPYFFPMDMSDEDIIKLALQRSADMESGRYVPIAQEEMMHRLRKDAD